MLARSWSRCALWVVSGVVLAGCGQGLPHPDEQAPLEGQIAGYSADEGATEADTEGDVEVDARSLEAQSREALSLEVVSFNEPAAEQALTDDVAPAVTIETADFGLDPAPKSLLNKAGSTIGGVPDASKRISANLPGMQARAFSARGEAARSSMVAVGGGTRAPGIEALPPPVAGRPPLAGGPPDVVPAPTEPQNPREHFTEVVENPFTRPADHALSTFGIDVDTASYSHMRRYVRDAQQPPPPKSVRIEEYLNYFSYDYAPPAPTGTPFAVHLEAAACPWAQDHRLVRVGLKGREIAHDKRPLSNLVFLIDVSGSMDQPDKLPLVKQGLRMLVEQLGENDRVAICVYAGAAGLVLNSTTGDKKSDILRTLDALQAGGSTAGGAGIRLAYSIALEHFIKGGSNRVILCTDGDFNVGVRSVPELQALIEEKAKTGVFLSVLGFGQGNIRDDVMETLADRGNGVYAHIDTVHEARRVFVEQTAGTLVTIAKDVKIQVEFNPAKVASYRLIGYENRALAARDFNDDKKDAGEIGAGHTVTALYEIVPVGVAPPADGKGEVDPLRYQKPAERTEAAARGELLHVKLRYKLPDEDQSTLVEFPLEDGAKAFGAASLDFRFAAAVASYGMLLRKSRHAGTSTMAAVVEMAEAAKGPDARGYRAEFIELVKKLR